MVFANKQVCKSASLMSDGMGAALDGWGKGVGVIHERDRTVVTMAACYFGFPPICFQDAHSYLEPPSIHHVRISLWSPSHSIVHNHY